MAEYSATKAEGELLLREAWKWQQIMVTQVMQVVVIFWDKLNGRARIEKGIH